MKRRDIKRYALEIAQSESVLQDNESSSDDKKKAMENIMKISGRIDSLEDMATIDEMVQDILSARI